MPVPPPSKPLGQILSSGRGHPTQRRRSGPEAGNLSEAFFPASERPPPPCRPLLDSILQEIRGKSGDLPTAFFPPATSFTGAGWPPPLTGDVPPPPLPWRKLQGRCLGLSPVAYWPFPLHSSRLCKHRGPGTRTRTWTRLKSGLDPDYDPRG